MTISIGSFQLLNHDHACKELEDYLDYRWLPAPIWHHDPKGLIAKHFQKLVLVMQYRNEVYPNDSFFEDAGTFENDLEHMRARYIPEERIVFRSQKIEWERLEW